MSESPPSTTPAQPPGGLPARPSAKVRKRTGRRLAIGAVVVCGVGVAAVVALYSQRNAIGVQLAARYFADRGVPAAIKVERLDFNGFVGSVTLGPPGAPDFTVKRLEVDFVPAPLWRRTQVPQIRAVRLVEPRLKALWRDGKLTFGSLQRIVDEVLAQPSTGPLPDMRIERGVLALDAPSGPILLSGDGALEKGRLTTATLNLAPARLAGFGAEADLASGDLALNVRGDRLSSQMHLTAAGVRQGGASAQVVEATVAADVPYPRTGFDRIEGPLSLDVALKAASASSGDATAKQAAARFQFHGTSVGPIKAMTLAGDGKLDISAASAAAAGSNVTQPVVNLVSERFTLGIEDARWRAAGVVQAALTASGARTQAAGRPLDLRAIRLASSGEVTAGPKGAALTLGGELSATAGFAPRDAAALTEALASQPQLKATATRALTSFRIDAPSFGLDVEGADARLGLRRPLRIAFAGGPEAVVTGRPGAEAFALAKGVASGAFNLAVAGGDLPKLGVEVSRYRAGSTLDAAAKIALAGSLGPVEQAEISLDTRITGSGGRLAVAAAGCAPVKAETVKGEDGALLLQAFSGEICPAEGGASLLASTPAGWSASARLAKLAAVLPAAMVRLADGEATAAFSGRNGTIIGGVDIARAPLTDTSDPVRFRPITLTGRGELAQDKLKADLAVALTAGAVPLAKVQLEQDPATGAGAATFETATLQFAPKGLQPAAIAPVAGQFLTEVNGPLAASGRIAWTKDSDVLKGGARVRTAGLDARTPAGLVKGIAGDIEIASLMPLATAPNQTVTVQRVEALVPLTDLTARVSLSDKGLAVSDAAATVAKGRASLDPLVVSFDPKEPLQGVLRMKGIDVADLLTAFNLSESVTMQAKVDGMLPFSISAAGIRFTGGKLMAEGPGRLSIRREALQGTVAGGAATATVETAPGAPTPPVAPVVQQNAVQDFAYQALENLAFDSLDATVDSRPEGRLGMVFHLKGRHDPPKAQEAKIPVTDLIRGTAFDKPIPLPKDTGVDLTLDTSLNFDQLLADYSGLSGWGAAK